MKKYIIISLLIFMPKLIFGQANQSGTRATLKNPVDSLEIKTGGTFGWQDSAKMTNMYFDKDTLKMLFDQKSVSPSYVSTTFKLSNYEKQADTIKGNIDTLEMKTLSWITPQMFGAKGDGTTNDWNAVNNALIYAKNHNIGVDFGTKTYAIDSSIDISGYSSDSNLYVKGENANLDFSGCVTCGNTSFNVRFSSDTIGHDTLIHAASKGDSTIIVNKNILSQAKRSDLIILFDSSTIWQGITAAKKGEICRITDIRNDTISTYDVLNDSYKIGTAVYLLNSAQAYWSGINIKGNKGIIIPPGGRLLLILDYFRDGIISNSKFWNSTVGDVSLRHSYNMRVQNITGHDSYKSGTGYTLEIVNSQHITADHIYSTGARHGFTTNPGNILNFPNRYFIVENSTFRSGWVQTGAYAGFVYYFSIINDHAESEFGIFRNNLFINCGVAFRDQNIDVNNNRFIITNPMSKGYYILSIDYLNNGYYNFSDNKIYDYTGNNNYLALIQKDHTIADTIDHFTFANNRSYGPTRIQFSENPTTNYNLHIKNCDITGNHLYGNDSVKNFLIMLDTVKVENLNVNNNIVSVPKGRVIYNVSADTFNNFNMINNIFTDNYTSADYPGKSKISVMKNNIINTQKQFSFTSTRNLTLANNTFTNRSYNITSSVDTANLIDNQVKDTSINNAIYTYRGFLEEKSYLDSIVASRDTNITIPGNLTYGDTLKNNLGLQNYFAQSDTISASTGPNDTLVVTITFKTTMNYISRTLNNLYLLPHAVFYVDFIRYNNTSRHASGRYEFRAYYQSATSAGTIFTTKQIENTGSGGDMAYPTYILGPVTTSNITLYFVNNGTQPAVVSVLGSEMTNLKSITLSKK